MNKKRLGRKLIATVVALSTVLSIGTALSFANPVQPSGVAVAKITKKVTKPADVFAPATSFTFTVAPGQAIHASGEQKEILAGLPNGVRFSNQQTTASIESKPGTYESETAKSELTIGELELVVNKDVMDSAEPGIYRYVVKETAGNYHGMTYDTKERYFDVYVNDQHQVVYSAFVTATDSKTKDDGVFTNDYDKNNTGEGDKGLGKLKITKNVTGNLGNKTTDFIFTIKIDGQTGEKFRLTTDGNQTVTIESGVQATFKLKHGQTATVTGLSDNDKYTVNENSYADQGYKTTYEGEHQDKTFGAEGVKSDAAVKVTNAKEINTPTGIVLSYGPYALLVVVAAAILVLFTRKRKSYED